MADRRGSVELRKLGYSVTVVVETGVETRQSPLGPNYTDTRSRHYAAANSRGEEHRAYKSRPVDCTVSIPFVVTASSFRRGEPAKRLFSFTRWQSITFSSSFRCFSLPFSSLFLFFVAPFASERRERFAPVEGNRGNGRDEEEPRERVVSLRRQKVRLITRRPQVPVKLRQRQLSAPKAIRAGLRRFTRTLRDGFLRRLVD